MKKILIGVAVIFGAVAWVGMAPRSTTFGLFSGNAIGRLLTVGIGYLATVVGAFLGSVYRDLRTRQQRGESHIASLGLFFADLSRSINLWMAITGSPIVFALLLKTTLGMGLSGMVVVALENGFSCLLVIDSLVGDKSQASGSKAPPRIGG